MNVSVILPFTRRDALFERAYRSAEKALARVPAFTAEILPIDDEARRGVSRARNEGLRRAQGEWIVFADADDAIAEDFFSDIFCPLAGDDVDLIVAGYRTVTSAPDREEEELPSDSLMTAQTHPGSYADMLDRETLTGYAYVEARILNRDTHVWGKAFRRSALMPEGEAALTFDETLTIGEDMLFLLDFALLTGKRRSIAVTERAGYLYTVNPEGAMERAYDPSYLDELRCWRKAEERLLSLAPAFSPYAFSALGTIRIRTALMVPLKLARLSEERRKQEDVQDAVRRTKEAVREALRRNGAFAGLSLKEKAKTGLFLASPELFFRLARKV